MIGKIRGAAGLLLAVGLLRTYASAQERVNPLGSGFVVSNQGHVVTNYHVMSDCNDIVFAGRGLTGRARVIAVDKLNDLALLQADRPLPTSLKLRDNSRIDRKSTRLNSS